MKLRILLFVATATLVATGVNAQRANRGDICQKIPELTIEQSQKIVKLGVTHQEKMDKLRSQFYAERNLEKASAYKVEMNTEMKNHYSNISALLSPDQQEWFDQNCYADGSGRYYARQGKGRGGQGLGRGGQGLGRGGQGLGRGGQGLGRGGQGLGRRPGRWNTN